MRAGPDPAGIGRLVAQFIFKVAILTPLRIADRRSRAAGAIDGVGGGPILDGADISSVARAFAAAVKARVECASGSPAETGCVIGDAAVGMDAVGGGHADAHPSRRLIVA